jgi:hypothetical protein
MYHSIIWYTNNPIVPPDHDPSLELVHSTYIHVHTYMPLQNGWSKPLKDQQTWNDTIDIEPLSPTWVFCKYKIFINSSMVVVKRWMKVFSVMHVCDKKIKSIKSNVWMGVLGLMK